MSKELIFIFKTKDMQRLINTGAKKIVVRSSIVDGELKDGSKAGVVKVIATAKKGKGENEEVIDGCPHPPCDPEED